MCITTSATYCQNNAPTTMFPYHNNNNTRSTGSAQALSSHLNVLLDNCEFSANSLKENRLPWPRGVTQQPNYHLKSGSILSEIYKINYKEEKDELPPISDDNILMSSINLEDSAGFLDLSDAEDDESENNHHNSDLLLLPVDSLFDPRRQSFEWKDDFSLLRKLKRSRLPAVEEDRNQEEQSFSSSS